MCAGFGAAFFSVWRISVVKISSILCFPDGQAADRGIFVRKVKSLRKLSEKATFFDVNT